MPHRFWKKLKKINLLAGNQNLKEFLNVQLLLKKRSWKNMSKMALFINSQKHVYPKY